MSETVTISQDEYEMLSTQANELIDLVNHHHLDDDDDEQIGTDHDVDDDVSPETFDISKLLPQKGRILSRDQRMIIQFLSKAGPGMSTSEISKRYGFSRHQIRRACNDVRATPTKRKRSKLLDENSINEIEGFITASHENRKLTFSQLAAGPFSHLNVSGSTIRRVMITRGYKRYIAISQFTLSQREVKCES